MLVFSHWAQYILHILFNVDPIIDTLSYIVLGFFAGGRLFCFWFASTITIMDCFWLLKSLSLSIHAKQS